MQQKFMRLAFEKAKAGMEAGLGGPFGGVIVKNNQVLAVACNQVLHDCDPTAHAEIKAIREAGQVLGSHDLSGCELYATGYPCPMCLAAMIWANISVCYFANDLAEAEKIGFRDQFIYDFLQGEARNKLQVMKLSDSEYCQNLYQAYQAKQGIIY